MATCFITQPIHPDAVAYLNGAGVATRYASRATMEAATAEIGGAEAVITRDLGFDEAAIRAAPNLRLVACHGSGTNRIAVAAAAERGIWVTNAPNTNSRSVAELTMGLILAAARRIPVADRAVRDGQWDFRYAAGGIELAGKTLGLIGFGAIARHVAAMAGAGFGMRVVAWSPNVPDAVFAQAGVMRVDGVEALLRSADIVSLHRPAGAAGATPIDAAALALLKPGALLVNTSRGTAIDSAALVAALQAGTLAGAALDVLVREPPLAHDPVLSAPGLILTPHLGGATGEALRRTAMLCAQQVIDALAGRTPAHCVQPPGT